MTMTTIEVIIPVRNMPVHIAECVGALRKQLCNGDALTVVDDGSTDETATVATELGARVRSIADSRGPYFARQVAARTATADVLLFVDARCRALPGLLEAHRMLQQDDSVALSCTAVRTSGGERLAQRIAARQQPFALAGKLGVPGRLDFYPTANLGIRRSAFEAVDGFRAMRSGADADICWRIQQAGLGRLVADRRELMTWIPRTTMRDLGSQWNRYGGSTAYLEWVHPGQSPTSTGKRVSIVDRLRTRSTEGRQPRPSPAEFVGSAVIATAYHWGYRTQRRKRSTFAEPVAYEIDPAVADA